MRKRTFAILVLFWGALAAVIWRAFEPLAFEWIEPRASAFAGNDANLIATIAAGACPLALSAVVVLFVFLLARSTSSEGSHRVAQAAHAAPPVPRKIIRIKPDKTLVHSGLRFGLVPIPSGGDGANVHGAPSKEIYFKKLGNNETLIAQVPYDQRLGLRFKCFVDYKGMPFERVKHALSASGYTKVTPKADRQFRAWFVLPNYRNGKALGGQIHNAV
jgi:hypothetical protein